MQISMEMLCDWLKKYDPEPDIRKNRRHLQNVRLFSENLRFSPTTVYLTPVADDRVVCTNENDILILRCEDVNEAFNDILDAFEYYNEMESRTFRRIEEGCTDQELVDMLAELTGFFVILSDTGFYMRATAGPERVRDRHTGLKDMIGQRMLPYAALEEISAQPYVRRHDMPPYLTVVPGLGTACVTNLFTGAEHAGWLIACGERMEFTQAEKDRIDCAGRIAECWLSRNRGRNDPSQKAEILLDLLHNTEGKAEKTEERLRTFGWIPADEKQVFVLKETDTPLLSAVALTERLELSFPDAFALRTEAGPTLLVNYALSGKAEIRRMLKELLRDCCCIAGESAVFRDIRELEGHMHTAALVAGLMQAQDGGIGTFQDVLLPYAMLILKKHAEKIPLHPALSVLEEYDRAHEGDLLHTLRIFLRENCSYTAAARALYIHRSTLIYRMERIVALTGIDPEDPDVRFLLQLSYYLKDEL